MCLEMLIVSKPRNIDSKHGEDSNVLISYILNNIMKICFYSSEMKNSMKAEDIKDTLRLKGR